MSLIGYHASHEQFSPRAMLDFVIAAEAAGFDAAMCSDHFAPWGASQNESGFAWAWLGAAMQATNLPMGVVTSPIGFRYHPAIIAQAAATLTELYPERFWLAAGSGEALNERVVGQGWPHKSERADRLDEAADIMRALWSGETVTRKRIIPVEDARLYSCPSQPPKLIGAALSPETARRIARWADGLITINQPRARLRSILGAFREGGGEGKPCYLQIHLSFATTDDDARRAAYEQWKTNALSGAVAGALHLPELFDEATRFVRPDDLDESVRISADLARHANWLKEDLELGFSALFLHNVGRNQRDFIERFGEMVLPQLR